MNQVSTVGLDLAKYIFQLHGADSAGAVVFRKKLRRGQLPYHGSVWWRAGSACDSRIRDERSALNEWDRATGPDRPDGQGGRPAAPGEDEAGQAGAAGGDDASGAQRKPDGWSGGPAAPDPAPGQPLPLDQAVSGHRAC